MININNDNGKLTFRIGKNTLPLTWEEAAKLREKIAVVGIDSDEETWSFGPWRLEWAGDYDHPWESRQRIIIYHGNKKWHLTMEELFSLSDNINHHLKE